MILRSSRTPYCRHYFMRMYTKDGATSKAPSKLVMILLCTATYLSRSRVFPKVFEHIYPAIFAVDEPHRLTQTLSCLYNLNVFVISLNFFKHEQCKSETDPMEQRPVNIRKWRG
ncbi:hypothetical protein COOONC_07062, partial [Cooperia oncophora]